MWALEVATGPNETSLEGAESAVTFSGGEFAQRESSDESCEYSYLLTTFLDSEYMSTGCL